ncbi:type IV pilus twitching motility protein PilT [Paenibacillus senegalimassiliensis]|uniref:type IV pilus twitching motility protein PilT n=1 Tax=Paenibacillus senegalimassiliensis TaxID=1737426 RepID=UPI00073F5713|nr:PilT/PilU family type 4a pilus ATPase [Paenibacillus senegalimassiliensis]
MVITVQTLFNFAKNVQASDIHITTGAYAMFRVNGRLRPLPNSALLTSRDAQDIAKQLMSEEQLVRLYDRGQTEFSYTDDMQARYRISVFLQKGTVSLVIRLLASRIPSLEQLGLPPAIVELANKRQGLLLVTGPTGSGKTTSLAAILDYINDTCDYHILTLEDPIEFVHPHKQSIFNQREIGRDSESFAMALKGALRQDPDVILIGEMRDLETIQIALTAAETGHLVLGTLHTGDAQQTIDRIINVFPPEGQQQVRQQLSSVLLGVMSQRLIPLKNGRGRVASVELLINTPAIANLIRSEKVHQIRSVMQTSQLKGMQSMDTAVRELLLKRLVTEEAAAEALAGLVELT